MIGRTISHYHITEKLGGGGMGVVYKAEDTRLKRTVALKFLPPDLTRDPDARDRFILEAQAASALDHVNICTIYEIDETEPAPAQAGGQTFIAMAYYPGETLKKKIERGLLSVEEAVEIAVQIAEGLTRAHEEGSIHRDVKPANVMVTDRGVVKIVDFGLAKVTAGVALTKTGRSVGTPLYMSPEQARGETVDARTDVWSLGVVLYEMLTGERPFRGDYEQAVIYSILNQDVEPVAVLRPEVPEALASVVDRALAKEPEARYGSMGEMLEALKACQVADMAQAAVQARKDRVRRRVVAAAVGSVVILALIGLSVALLQARSESKRVLWVTQQLVEIERLANDGKYAAAFALAEEVGTVAPDDPTLARLWPRFSFSTPIIRSDPPGAQVYRQPIDASEDEWELLGATPLDSVRFVEGIAYRLRLEADGHRTVELLSTAFQGLTSAPSLDTFILDPVDVLPEEMVRVPGFGRDSTDTDFFMDRYEVTNRAYKRFVDAGGYQNPAYWTHPFVRKGVVLTWEEAVAGFEDLTGRPGPGTWRLGTYPEGQADHPVGGVSWYEAAAYARFVNKELPTIFHWARARRFYNRVSEVMVPRSNLEGDGPRAVSEGRAMSSFGVYDLIGNVREWCYNEAGDGRATRGSAWTDAPFHVGWIIPKSPYDRHETHGIRLVRTFDDRLLARLRRPVDPTAERDYQTETPASEAEYEIYRRLYAYDPTPLNAVVERADTFDLWIREKVMFDLPYGERGGAYLYLPIEGTQPLQPVVYWGGSNILATNSIDNQYMRIVDFLLRSGRAVALPMFNGAYTRDDSLFSFRYSTLHSASSAYRDYTIQWVKEFSRTIDYLETRPDVDAEKIAYFGFSWGGWMAPIALTVDDRITVAALNVGGLPTYWRYLPEIDPINFITRVRSPVLMINGEVDPIFPLPTSQQPMFDLLGTDPAHKKLHLTKGGHFVPLNELIRETLDWLDKYLGPVE